MTFSYSGNPASSDLDAVRFFIGDTDSTEWLLSNEEINFLIDTYGVKSATVHSCIAIASKYARLADENLGSDIAVKYSQISDNYRSLAKELSSLNKSNMTPPTSGGAVSEDVKDAIFDKGMMEND